MEIILASASPRRRELLGKLYSDFNIITADVDETLPEGVVPRNGVEILAIRKGAVVAAGHPTAVVISSDTLVEIDDMPLGKPTSREDAFRMLSMLSGRYHNVHTGVAVHCNGVVKSGVATARVKFYDLNDGEIWDYIDTNEPMDKAGSYAIQGIGGKFIEGYDGDFDTIMGLSVSLTSKLIDQAIGESDD